MRDLIAKILIITGFIILSVALFVSSEALLGKVVDINKFFMGLLYGFIGIIIIAIGGLWNGK